MGSPGFDFIGELRCLPCTLGIAFCSRDIERAAYFSVYDLVPNAGGDGF
jgi:hypothetical protein